jgi:hypothetical protein
MGEHEDLAASRANGAPGPDPVSSRCAAHEFHSRKKRPLEILREKPAHWLPICAQFMRASIGYGPDRD